MFLGFEVLTAVLCLLGYKICSPFRVINVSEKYVTFIARVEG
jgi:hypothetical protein